MLLIGCHLLVNQPLKYLELWSHTCFWRTSFWILSLFNIFKLFTAHLIPLLAAYISPSTSLYDVLLKLVTRSPQWSQSTEVRMAGWGPVRTFFCSIYPPPSSLFCSPRRRTGWWETQCFHDRSGLTSSSHLLWSPRVSFCRRARSGLFRITCTKKCTHLSSDFKT